jgi:CRP-like cAMP-binding protein
MSQVTSLNSSVKSKAKKLVWQKYKPGAKIPISDSGVWQVDRGVVQLSRLKSDGNEVIVGFVTANGTFGTFEHSFSSSLVVYRATALSNVDLKYYSQQDIAESPMLARNLLANFSDRLEKTQQLSTIMLINRIKERLRQLLLMFKQEMGIPSADGVRLQVRFTHQHLAHIIGTTRVTIHHILKDFQRQGLICLDSERHMVIKGL